MAIVKKINGINIYSFVLKREWVGYELKKEFIYKCYYTRTTEPIFESTSLEEAEKFCLSKKS